MIKITGRRIFITALQAAVSPIITWLLNKIIDMSWETIYTITFSLIIGGLLITWIMWVVMDIIKAVKFEREKINLLRVKMKYYDVLTAKNLIQNPHPVVLFQESDLGWFTDEEKKLLQIHFDQITKIKTQVKGSSV